MNKSSVVKIKPSYTAIVQFVFFGMLSAFPFALVYTTGSNLGLVSMIFVYVLSSLIFYSGIKKIFIKKIEVFDDKILFHSGPFRYQLDREKLTIHCEKVFVLGGNYKDYFGLVLYRDKNKIVSLSMNNRFVIAYEIDDVKLEYYQQEFRDKIGIDIKVIKPFL